MALESYIRCLAVLAPLAMLSGACTVNGAPGEWTLDARLEADPGAPAAIDWESLDPDVARITPEGVMTAGCRESRAETGVVARSRADPRVSATVHVTVERTQLWECPGSS